MTSPDFAAHLRWIAGLPPKDTSLLYCSTCTAAILSVEIVTWKHEVVCPACGLEEAAAVAVQALSVHEPDADLATLERALEVLRATTGTFAETVRVIKRRVEGTP